MVQMGNTDDDTKPRFASLKKGQSLDTISLSEALDLYKLPRVVGEFESTEVVISTGRFGPYVRHQSAFYTLPKEDDPLAVTLERAVEIIVHKRQVDSQNILHEFQDATGPIRVINGRFGAYIAHNKENYKIPRGNDPLTLTLEACKNIIANTEPSKSKSKKKK